MAIIMSMSTVGCKNTSPDVENLCNIAKKVNSEGGVKRENGMILTKCTFNEGDTVFTYFIKVEDNRLDKVTPDELKSTIAKEDMKKDSMKKITALLKKNNYGLQYVFDTPKKILTVFFDSSEL